MAKKIKLPTLEESIERIVKKITDPNYKPNPFLTRSGGKTMMLKAVEWEKNQKKPL